LIAFSAFCLFFSLVTCLALLTAAFFLAFFSATARARSFFSSFSIFFRDSRALSAASFAFGVGHQFIQAF
jgi:hypothetical protein